MAASQQQTEDAVGDGGADQQGIEDADLAAAAAPAGGGGGAGGGGNVWFPLGNGEDSAASRMYFLASG